MAKAKSSSEADRRFDEEMREIEQRLELCGLVQKLADALVGKRRLPLDTRLTVHRAGQVSSCVATAEMRRIDEMHRKIEAEERRAKRRSEAA